MVVLKIQGDGTHVEAVYNKLFDRMEARAKRFNSGFASSFEREAARLARDVAPIARGSGGADRTIREQQRAAREVQRIHAETARQAAQQERIREQAARTLANVQIREARRSANEVIKTLGEQRAANSANLSAMTTAAKGAAGAVAAVVLMLLGIARTVYSTLREAFDRAASFEALKLGLKAVVGSSIEAERQLERLKEAAKLPGLNYRGVIEMSTSLQAAGLSAEISERAIKAFGNALATVGRASRENLQGVTLALSQIAGTEFLQGDELRQLQERLPQVSQALKAAFGTARSEDLRKMGVTSREVLEKLTQQLEKLPRSTGGAQNALENLSDAYDQALVSLGTPLLEPVAKELVKFTSLLEGNQQAVAEWGQLVGESIRAFRVMMESEIGSAIGWIIKLEMAIARVNAQNFLKWFDTMGGTLSDAKAILDRGRAAATGPDIVGGAGQTDHFPRTVKNKDSAVNQAARAEMRLAELDLKAAERVYKEATTTAQRAYDLRNTSLKKFVEQQVAAEEALEATKLAALKKELTAAENLTQATQAQIKIREVALREVEEKRKDVISEYMLKTQQLRDSAAAKELESFREFGKVLLDLTDDVDKRRIASLEAIAESGLISFERLENERLRVLTESFQRHREVKAAELAFNVNNKQKQREIVGELMKLASDEATAREDSTRRISAARRKDIDNARRHAQELRALQLENQQTEVGIGAGRLDRLERFGVNSDFLKAARADQDARVEILRNASMRQDILAQQAATDYSGMSADKRDAFEAAFRTKMELAEQIHQENLREIRERPMVEYMERIKEYADGVGEIFADALTTWEDGFKGFWDSLINGFKRMFASIVREFVQSRISEYLQSLFRPSNAPSLAQGNTGGGFSFGNILNSITRIFGGGNRTTTEGAHGSSGGGIFGAIRNLIGVGGRAAAPAAAASSGASVGGALGGATGLAALLGSGGAAAGAAGTGMASAAAGALGAGGAAAGGGSMMAGLIPLLSNPVTIIAGAAAVTGFFLWKKFRSNPEKRLRDAIKTTYGIDVRDQSVLKQIKEIGEQTFGRGNVGKHISEVLRLEPVKEILAAYAESTGQKSTLVTQQQLGDASFVGNQHIVREGDDGAPSSSGRIPALIERLRSQAQSSASSSSSGVSGEAARGGTSGKLESLMERLLQMVAVNTQMSAYSSQMSEAVLNKVQTMRPGDVLAAGAEENPRAVSRAVESEADSNQGFKDSFFRKSGFAS